jgi:hypothetical protein
MKRYLIPLVIAGACISSACTSVGGGVAVREPGVRVGINVSTYPRLSRVPGYPVYYAPGAGWNYFFYEDRYWVFEEDLWYASRGYNGPWDVIDPYYVPSYVLRVPVRYYTRPPSYFRGWRADAPPRWDEHWGRDWSARRSDWNRWDPRSAPPPAPLPPSLRRNAGERDPSTPGLQRSNQPENSRRQQRDSSTEQPGLQRGNGSRPRAEPQQDTRSRQPSRVERAPPAAQPQEQPRRPQPEAQDRGQQQDDAPADRGRDRKGRLDQEDNPRGR